MTHESKPWKSLLRFYLDPELLSKDEAEEELIDIGIDNEKLNERGEQLIKKLEARLKLTKGKSRKEAFGALLAEFNILKSKMDISEGEYVPKFGYRNKRDDNVSSEEIDDVKFLNFLDEKDKEEDI